MSDKLTTQAFEDLKSKDESIRLAAIRQLGKANLQLDKVVPCLVKAMNDYDINVCTASSLALRAIGINSVGILANMVQNDDIDEDTRAYAADALGELGKDGLPYLMKFIDFPDFTIKLMAIEAIPRAGIAGEVAIPTLAKALRDPDVMGPAAISLAQFAKTRPFGSNHKNIAFDTLALAFKEEDVNLRRSVISALRYLGDKTSDASEILRDAMQDSDEEVRQTANAILEKFDTKH